MRKIWYGFGNRGDWHEGEFTIPDNTTDTEIYREVKMRILDELDWRYEEVKTSEVQNG